MTPRYPASEPHTIGTDAPTPENDPIGRFRPADGAPAAAAAETPAPAPPFARTSCACAVCVRCCHDQPGSLVPGDLERIAQYLGKPVRAVLSKFWASPGALVGDSRTGRTFRIGTITPKRTAGESGRCVFLDAEDRCTIHPVAPAGCALFDTHMSGEEGHRRGSWMVMQQSEPAYQSIRRTLDPATSYKPKGY